MRHRSPSLLPLLPVLAASALPGLSAAAPQELLTTVTRTEHNYGGGTSCTHTTDPCLNVYAPARAIEGRPTVLWIHGGGWSIPESNKDSPFNDLMCTTLAAAGGYVVSCDYFLSGYDPCGGSTTGADFLQTIQDIKRVIAWIRGKGTEIYGFPHALVVAGSSAGGHLAARMAVTHRVSAQEGLAFAARVNERNADPHRCDVLTFEPPGCLGCRHGAEAFTEAGLADNILQLVRARFR